eukprot:1297829-Rhodomonas_salina.1
METMPPFMMTKLPYVVTKLPFMATKLRSMSTPQKEGEPIVSAMGNPRLHPSPCVMVAVKVQIPQYKHLYGSEWRSTESEVWYYTGARSPVLAGGGRGACAIFSPGGGRGEAGVEGA